MGEDLKELQQQPMKNVFIENGKLLVVIDSSGIYPKKASTATLPTANRLSKDEPGAGNWAAKPQKIIADGRITQLISSGGKRQEEP